MPFCHTDAYKNLMPNKVDNGQTKHSVHAKPCKKLKKDQNIYNIIT